MDNEQLELEQKMQELMGPTKRTHATPSPFLKGRILAHQKERAKNKKKFFLWQSLTGAITLCLLITFFTFKNLKQDVSFEAMLGTPYVMKLALNDVTEDNIGFVKVNLPPGVHFYSKTNPDIQNMDVLELDWQFFKDRKHLTLVIVGNISGDKEIQIEFMGNEDKKIRTKNINVKFVRKS